MCEQVQIWVQLSREDPLRAEKLKLLHDHCIETDKFGDGSDSGGAWFGLRFVFLSHPWGGGF